MGKTKSEESSREEKRSKKKHKKEKKKKHERSHKKKKSKEKSRSPGAFGPLPPPSTSTSEEICGPSPPSEIAPKSYAPMRKEDWEKQQNVVRRVYDEETGRSRLVKGDGEILEEIVSRDRHKEINRKATLGDGQYFQSVITQNVKK